MKKLSLFFFLLLFGSLTARAAEKIRVGYFPNITHAQALIGMANLKFQQALGSSTLIEPKIFNAGPSAAQALLGEDLDLAYIGPSPAVIAYVKSHGGFKIIAGAASGGSALVVRNDLPVQSPKDFAATKIATPQMGNSQDVAARAWLASQGLKTTEQGGSVTLLPVANTDQLTQFLKKQIDAAWTVEPWVSRLVEERVAKIYLYESEMWKPITGGDYATTVVLVSDKFLKQEPEIVEKWLKVHCEITDWIAMHPGEAKKILNWEIKKITGKPFGSKVLDDSFAQVRFTYNPIKASVLQHAKWDYQNGFLEEEPDISGLFDLEILNRILQIAGKRLIR